MKVKIKNVGEWKAVLNAIGDVGDVKIDLEKFHPELSILDVSENTPENKSQDVEELDEDLGNLVLYKDVFEKLDSNENIEQTITDFLGSDWFDKTEKFVGC